MIPALFAILLMLMTGFLPALNIVGEKEKGTIEQINVTGITFRYTAEGVPEGLCRAKRLTYLMTSGGTSVPEDYGFGYVKTLSQSFYGIPDVRLIKAEGLDIIGADPESILHTAEEQFR